MMTDITGEEVVGRLRNWPTGLYPINKGEIVALLSHIDSLKARNAVLEAEHEAVEGVLSYADEDCYCNECASPCPWQPLEQAHQKAKGE